MPVHADCQAEDDGCDAEDSGNSHRGVPLIDKKAKNNCHGNKQQGHHSHGGLGGAGSHIHHAVLDNGAEGAGHDGAKGGHYQNNGQVSKYCK